MLKLGITEKKELVGMEFNFGAHSLILPVTPRDFAGSGAFFLKLCLLSPAKS